MDLPASPADDLASVSFLVGHWRGREVSETWVRAGSSLVGVGFSPGPGGTTFFEVLTIEAVDGRIVYRARPMGASATPFTLVDDDDPHQAVFLNPLHDDPQRIRYRHSRGLGRGRLVAGIGTAEGVERARLRFRRRSLPPAYALFGTGGGALVSGLAPAYRPRLGFTISGLEPGVPGPAVVTIWEQQPDGTFQIRYPAP